MSGGGRPGVAGGLPGIPLPFQVPSRDPGDLEGATRITDWSGGYDQERLQQAFAYLYVSPRYYDAQNVDPHDLPGKVRLCSRWKSMEAATALDYEYLLYPFNGAIYRFPTKNADVTKVQKTTQGTGVPTWQALANVFPAAVNVKNAVIWRDKLYIATGEGALRIMDAAESWTTLAAPVAVGGALAGQVGIAQDDRLVVFYESKGLYAWDGTGAGGWIRLFPASTAGTDAPAQAFCDLIVRGSGSLMFVTRDASGISTLYEYATEPTGVFIVSQIQEGGMRFWPQGGEVFQNATWFGARGASHNQGVLYNKEYRQPPNPIAVISTNYATPGQRDLDWAVRCMFSAGDILYLGCSSRYDHNAALYHVEVDEDGTLIHPSAVISAMPGPIYSLAMLPWSGGVSTADRLFASCAKQTFYKDADGTGDPTVDDCPIGFIQNAGIDKGIPDHLKVASFGSVIMLERSNDGGVDLQYRVDSLPDDPWITLGSVAPGADGEGEAVMDFPNDDAAAQHYGTASRLLDTRIFFTRPTAGSVRDLVDAIAIDFSRIIPLSAES